MAVDEEFSQAGKKRGADSGKDHLTAMSMSGKLQGGLGVEAGMHEDVGLVTEDDGSFVRAALVQPAEIRTAIGRGIHRGDRELSVWQGETEKLIPEHAQTGRI